MATISARPETQPPEAPPSAFAESGRDDIYLTHHAALLMDPAPRLSYEPGGV